MDAWVDSRDINFFFQLNDKNSEIANQLAHVKQKIEKIQIYNIWYRLAIQ